MIAATFRYRLSAIENLMSHIDGHQDHLIAKGDLKKDILRRKAQLSQVIRNRMYSILLQLSNVYLTISLWMRLCTILYLFQMEDYLPRNSGRYLKIILGNVNVSILDKDAKYQYKEEYEQFKLSIMLIGKK